MKVYLVGYPACGKTTLGKKIARKLGYNFVDLDLLFEETYHVTISDFFGNYGEDVFRICEKKILRTASQMNNTVIATGGGAPCFFDNMDYINKNGLSIYIKKPAKFLAERLRNAKSVRPLFRGISNEDMLSYITTQLVEREYYYMKAKVVVQQQNVDEVVEIIKTYSV